MNRIWRIFLGLLLVSLLAFVFWKYLPASAPDQVSAVLEGMPVSSGTFARVTGPSTLVFPQDFGAHPDTQTEWWYFTGNLSSADGRQFGFQLTFFRRGLLGPDVRTERSSAWAADQVYLAHFALTDVNNGAFHPFERIERGAAGMAGASGDPLFQVWLRDWSVKQVDGQAYQLRAFQDGLGLELNLRDVKGPILQGEQGYSQKGPEAGNASTYVSLTRLETEGQVTLAGQKLAVSGTTWMDHEFGTSALAAEQIGWDWFSIQLDDGRELMMYTIRRKDGTIDPFSRGAVIAKDGSIDSLQSEDFAIQVDKTWKSPHSGGTYPAAWTVRVTKIGMQLKIVPVLADQELNNSFVYWEGAVRIEGSQDGKTLKGVGYTELTGYARSFEGGF
jgi:predicted secreted hydrolase